MSQEIFRSNYTLTSSESAGTDYIVYTAPTENCVILIKTPFFMNNSNSDQDITVKVQKYDGSQYIDIGKYKRTIIANTSNYMMILTDLCLYGSTSNPDRIVVSFSNNLVSDETIDILLTGIKLS